MAITNKKFADEACELKRQVLITHTYKQAGGRNAPNGCFSEGFVVTVATCMTRVGQNRIYALYDRIFDEIPAKNT
jgi:cytochrome c-type biogenesis protein CcmH/NrfG